MERKIETVDFRLSSDPYPDFDMSIVWLTLTEGLQSRNADS